MHKQEIFFLNNMEEDKTDSIHMRLSPKRISLSDGSLSLSLSFLAALKALLTQFNKRNTNKKKRSFIAKGVFYDQ